MGMLNVIAGLVEESPWTFIIPAALVSTGSGIWVWNQLQPITHSGISRASWTIIPRSQDRLWWHMGSQAGQPCMQIVGDFYFTNTGETSSHIVKAYLVIHYLKWGVMPLSKRVEGNAMLRHPAGDSYGLHEIMPHFMTEGRADWYLTPAVVESGKPLYGRPCFIDQYGNEHWVGALTWKYN